MSTAKNENEVYQQHVTAVLAKEVAPWGGRDISEVIAAWGPPVNRRECKDENRSVYEYLRQVEPLPGTTTPVHALIWFEVSGTMIKRAWMPLTEESK